MTGAANNLPPTSPHDANGNPMLEIKQECVQIEGSLEKEVYECSLFMDLSPDLSFEEARALKYKEGRRAEGMPSAVTTSYQVRPYWITRGFGAECGENTPKIFPQL